MESGNNEGRGKTEEGRSEKLILLPPSSLLLPSFMTEILKAMTPLFLAATGGAIAIVAMLSPTITNEKFAISMGVVGTFGAGAAGLASPQKEREK
jgi:hypothetical protein